MMAAVGFITQLLNGKPPDIKWETARSIGIHCNHLEPIESSLNQSTENQLYLYVINKELKFCEYAQFFVCVSFSGKRNDDRIAIEFKMKFKWG